MTWAALCRRFGMKAASEGAHEDYKRLLRELNHFNWADVVGEWRKRTHRYKEPAAWATFLRETRPVVTPGKRARAEEEGGVANDLTQYTKGTWDVEEVRAARYTPQREVEYLMKWRGWERPSWTADVTGMHELQHDCGRRGRRGGSAPHSANGSAGRTRR